MSKKFIIDKDTLHNLYITQNIPACKIADMYNVNRRVINRRMRIKELGLVKNESDKRIRPNRVNHKELADRLIQLYINENNTLDYCMKELGISRGLIYDVIKEFNIVKSEDSKSDCRSKWLTKYDMHEIVKALKQLYIEEGLTAMEVKNILHTSNGIFYNACNILNYKRPMEERLASTRKTNLKKYGCKYPLMNDDIQAKCSTVGTSHRISKTEEELYNKLLEKFDKEDIMRQYKSDLYPFYCDFYIKSLDLYIEYQGGWTHGPKAYHQPFDPNNPHHIEELNRLKTKNSKHQFPNNNYWTNVINTWTNRDPLKRQIAKDNKINIIEFFTLKDFNNWFKSLN